MTETSVPTPTAVLSAGRGNNESLMPPKRSGYITDGAPDQEDNGSDGAQNYWFSLINEKEAASFLDLTARTLQKHRQTGEGAKFYRLSARSIKYRRIDLHNWAEARMCISTSDPGKAA